MNNDAMIATATRILDELIADCIEDGTPLNDDDFADFAEIIMNDEKIDFDPSDIANLMITICDERNIEH